MAHYAHEIRNNLATAATGVSGGTTTVYSMASGRVKLGYNVINRTDKAFLEDFSGAASPYMVIMPAELLDKDPETGSNYRIDCHLWIGIVRGSSDNFFDIEDFVDALAAALGAGNRISYALQPIDSSKHPLLAHYIFSVTVRGC